MISFKDYKKELSALNDEELMMVANLVDDVAHQVLRGAQDGGESGALRAYNRAVRATHSEVLDFIGKRLERVSKMLK
jgi:hypothetical protein